MYEFYLPKDFSFLIFHLYQYKITTKDILNIKGVILKISRPRIYNRESF